MERIIEKMKLLNEDHTPDGYPAVMMNEINELLIHIDRQAERIAELEANQAIRDLEQQIKVLEEIRKYCVKQVRLHGYSNFTVSNTIQLMQSKEKEIAKQLKEQE